MADIDYMKDEKVRNYYDKWELNPEFTQQYKEFFYKFVKACLAVDKQASWEPLQKALIASFSKVRRNYNIFEGEVIVLFRHLRDFSNTEMP